MPDEDEKELPACVCGGSGYVVVQRMDVNGKPHSVTVRCSDCNG